VRVGHVRSVHSAQRRAHRSRNRRLGQPTLTQQHHLDALALRRWYPPAKRSSQPLHLGFAAFEVIEERPLPRGRNSVQRCFLEISG
jgi:hypothetical protein